MVLLWDGTLKQATAASRNFPVVKLFTEFHTDFLVPETLHFHTTAC
jgi:hypothetical protein